MRDRGKDSIYWVFSILVCILLLILKVILNEYFILFSGVYARVNYIFWKWMGKRSKNVVRGVFIVEMVWGVLGGYI